MVRKLFLLSILTALSLALFAGVGCDKLITQVNNNTVYDSTLGTDCKRCHGDDDSKIRVPRSQWENSRHASPDFIEASVSYNGKTYLTSDCGRVCHTSQGYIQYVTNGLKGTVAVPASPSAINCFTCHLPHTGTYGAWSMDTLRGMQEQVDLGGYNYYKAGTSNMCVSCHRAAHVPTFAATPGTSELDTSTAGVDGPHSSIAANIMIGYGAYRFRDTTITNSHVSVLNTTKNGCLACHYGVSGTSVAGNAYEFGEHTFRLLNRGTSEQYVANCNVAGCHASSGTLTPITDFFASPRLDTIRMLGDSLAKLLIDYHVLTGSDSDSTAFYKDSTVPSDIPKILYNYLYYKKDHSRGVHNTNYTLQILKETVSRWDSIPKPSFTAKFDTVCAVADADSFFSASTGSITSSIWSFGDSSNNVTVPGPPGNVEHIFAKAGTFVVKLTISGSAGKASSSMTVVVDSIPTAKFAVSKDSVLVGEAVTFTDQSTRNPTSWLWNFGDGVGTSYAKDTTYTYLTAGSYTVTLTATNHCGSDTYERLKKIEVTVSAAPPLSRR